MLHPSENTCLLSQEMRRESLSGMALRTRVGDKSWDRAPYVTLHSVVLNCETWIKMKFNITSGFKESENRLKLYNWRDVERMVQSFAWFLVGVLG